MEFMKPGTFGQNITPAVPAEEPHEIEGGAPAITTEPAPPVLDTPVGSGEAEETALNQPPVTEEPPAEQPTAAEPPAEEPPAEESPAVESSAGDPTSVKHHLTYLGHGIWKDITGQCWHRDDGKKGCISHKLMSEDEFQQRPDIKFMVKYGTIKDVIVK